MIGPAQGNDLPPAPPTALPVTPLPGPGLTHAETAHQPTPLALQARTLAGEVAALRIAADALAGRTTKHGWVLALTTLGLALDIGLSIFAFVLLHTQSATATQLAMQQKQLTAQIALITALQNESATTRKVVLCPLYDLIIARDTPTARANDPQGTASYDAGMKVVRAGSAALQCG